MGGAGHLFQAFSLAAFLYSHFPPWQRERNIGLSVKTFNFLDPFSVFHWKIRINIKSSK